jgi:hypothetical protein
MGNDVPAEQRPQALPYVDHPAGPSTMSCRRVRFVLSGANPKDLLLAVGGAATIAQAGIAGGQIPVPPMAGTLTLPPFSLGAVNAAARLGEGRAAVEKLEAKGGDAELTTDAISVVLQPRLEFAPVTGRAQLRLQPALWQKPAAAALRPVAEAALASARGTQARMLSPMREALEEVITAAGLVRRAGTNLNQAVAKLNATGQRGDDLVPAAQFCARVIQRLDKTAEQLRRSVP